MSAVRRSGDNHWLLRLHCAGVGRVHWGDGQHPHPPLRGRPPPQIRRRHDGHLLQGTTTNTRFFNHMMT